MKIKYGNTTLSIHGDHGNFENKIAIVFSIGDENDLFSQFRVWLDYSSAIDLANLIIDTVNEYRNKDEDWVSK